MNVEPRYIHDCDVCEFVGQLVQGDLWWCLEHRQWVVRRGDDGENYLSASILALEELLGYTRRECEHKWRELFVGAEYCRDCGEERFSR